MAVQELESMSFAFFHRNGLTESDRDHCHDLALLHYPGAHIQPLASQGWCSYTLLITLSSRFTARTLEEEKLLSDSRKLILQFRPPTYCTKQSILSAAKEIYTSFAPAVLFLCSLQTSDGNELWLYAQSCLQGDAYSMHQLYDENLKESKFHWQARLLTGFAEFMARGWHWSVDQPSTHSCDGKVGARLSAKLERAGRELPSPALRLRAKRLSKMVGEDMLDQLPVVLNHGDVIPSNILLHPRTGEMTGLVDWAEAEWLPFGTCLYGVEYLLGYFDAKEMTFNYYHRESELRAVFWKELEERIPRIKTPQVRDAVLLARELGILLWFGYAWDDGKIDRVVNRKEDPTEVACLESFLGVVGKESASL